MNVLFMINFGAYIGLAFVLFAIQQATNISNRYIPMTAIILGILFSWFEADTLTFDYNIVMMGIKYGLYGMGTVATIKYIIIGDSSNQDCNKTDDLKVKRGKKKDNPYKEKE